MSIMSCTQALSSIFINNYYICLFYKKTGGAQVSLIRFDHEWHIIIILRKQIKPFISKITNLVCFDILTRKNLKLSDLVIMYSTKTPGLQNKIIIKTPELWVNSGKIDMDETINSTHYIGGLTSVASRCFSRSFITKDGILQHKYAIWHISKNACFGLMKNRAGALKYFYKSAHNDMSFSLENNYNFSEFNNNYNFSVKEQILDTTWTIKSCTPFFVPIIPCRDAIKLLNNHCSLTSWSEIIRVEILGLLSILGLGQQDPISKQTFINIINEEYGFRSITRDINNYIRENCMLDCPAILLAWDNLMYFLQGINLHSISSCDILCQSPESINLQEILHIIKANISCELPLWNDFISCITTIAESEERDGIPPALFSKILEEVYRSEITLFNYI